MLVTHWNMRFFPLVGGIGTHIASVIKNNSDIQFDVVTNALRGQPSEEKFAENTTVHRFRPYDAVVDQWRRWGRKVLVPQSAAAEILRTFRQRKYLWAKPPSLINLHDVDKYTIEILRRLGPPRRLLDLFNGMFAPDKLPAPVLLTKHFDTMLIPDTSWASWERSFTLQFRNVIVLNETRRKFWENEFSKHGRDAKIWCVPNGVNVDAYHPAGCPPSGKLTIGYAGRLDVLKGEQLLEEVMTNLPSQTVFHAAVPRGERVPSWIQRLQGDKCRISYDIPYDRMPDFYRTLDIFINTTMVSASDRTILEAMACGVPVIKVAAGDDFPVIDGESGLLIAPIGREAIRAIAYLRDNRQLLEAFSRKSRRIIVEQFDERKMAAKIREIYLKLAGS